MTSAPAVSRLAPAYALSSATAALAVIASAAGLLNPAAVYPSRDLLRTFVPNDAVNLVMGVPLLLYSMWLARRGVLVGLLLWPGALLYLLYNYLVPLFCVPLNPVYPAYLALVTASVYALGGLLLSIDGGAVQRRIQGIVPAKTAGAILVALGTLTLARSAGVILGAVAKHRILGAPDRALCNTDFLIAPAFLAGGILLWRRKTFGYAVGLSLLFVASMLFVGLIVYMILQPYTTGAAFVPGAALLVLAMGLVVFVPFGLFVRATLSGRSS